MPSQSTKIEIISNITLIVLQHLENIIFYYRTYLSCNTDCHHKEDIFITIIKYIKGMKAKTIYTIPQPYLLHLVKYNKKDSNFSSNRNSISFNLYDEANDRLKFLNTCIDTFSFKPPSSSVNRLLLTKKGTFYTTANFMYMREFFFTT